MAAMAIEPVALQNAAANLRHVADTTQELGRSNIYDSFPDQEKSEVAAAARPSACQVLVQICVHCGVFTGKLLACDTVCDLKSCSQPLVSIQNDCYRVSGISGKLAKLTGLYQRDGTVNGKVSYVNRMQCRMYFNAGWKLHTNSDDEADWCFSHGCMSADPPEGHWQASRSGESACAVSTIPRVTGLAHVLTGRLEGAVYCVAVPKLWNHRLLIYLHGTRPLGAPLVAELNLQGECFRWLLNDGWMIAATSYRVHGLALSEALEDVVGFRQHLPKLIGEEPVLVLLEGHSMGGLVATLLMERRPDLFSAAVCVGTPFNNARLDLPQNRSASTAVYGSETKAFGKLEPITYRPRAPLLLLVNDSEASPAAHYGKRAWELHDSGDDDVIVPAVWVIRRPGHVAVNQAERLNALLSAVQWARYGSFGSARGQPVQGDEALWKLGPASEDTTLEPASPPVACRVTTQILKQAHGDIRAIRHTGAFTTSVTREALEELGIRRIGDRFRVTLGDLPSDPPFHVLMATLSEAPQLRAVEDYGLFGEFESDYDWLGLAMKTNEYCNIAKALCLQVGMRVVIEAVDLPPSFKGRPRSKALAHLRGASTATSRDSAKGPSNGKGKSGKSSIAASGAGKGKDKSKGSTKGKWIPRIIAS